MLPHLFDKRVISRSIAAINKSTQQTLQQIDTHTLGECLVTREWFT